MPGVPADPDLIPTPEFTHTFIKTYLEELAVLGGREKSSVTEDLIESYKTYTNKCTQVTTMGLPLNGDNFLVESILGRSPERFRNLVQAPAIFCFMGSVDNTLLSFELLRLR